jgi:hypothetical protein
MATSGTYDFNPSFGGLLTGALARCGIRRTSILQEHLQDGATEANLLLSRWSNKGPTLWTIDLLQIALVAGQASYTLPESVIMVTDAYIRTYPGQDSNPTDRVITPLSRTEYASLPNKDQIGYPTTFWFDRQIAPVTTLWEVPDDSQPYTLCLYYWRQVQDAGLAGGMNIDLPYRWLDAFVAELAVRLARIYAPDRLLELKAEAKEAWDDVSTQDTEDVDTYIFPGLQSYYRI